METGSFKNFTKDGSPSVLYSQVYAGQKASKKRRGAFAGISEQVENRSQCKFLAGLKGAFACLFKALVVDGREARVKLERNLQRKQHLASSASFSIDALLAWRSQM